MRSVLTAKDGSILSSLLPYALPFFLGSLAVALAFLAAALTGDDNVTGGVNGFVERLSGRSSTFLGDVSPINAFAFIAGMVATVNPCGFAMLPAYLGLYLTSSESGSAVSNPVLRLAKALLIGVVVSSGIVLLFGITGILINQGASAIVDYFPWIGLSIGIILAVTGSWLLGGGKLYSSVFGSAASRVGNPGQVGIRSYFLFGISYGIASLSCTLPIFLAVVGFSFTGLGESIGQFIIYGMGMGTVIIALTLGMAVFKQTMVGLLRKALPYVQPFSALLMIMAGAYIVYYWLTLGDLIF